MSQRSMRRQRSREEWRKLVQRMRESALKQSEFAREVGVSSEALSKWAAEFAKEEATLRSTDS